MRFAAFYITLNILPLLVKGEKYPGQNEDLEDPLQRPYAQPAETYNMSQEDQNIVLAAHNYYRGLHQNTGNLTWNNTLATYAAEYVAAYECASGTIEHSDYEFGENIAIGHSVNGSVNGWYSEIKDYNFERPAYQESIGHFSQLVWKETTQVGCAVRYCNSYWGNITVCEYDPSGNWDDTFAENVQDVVEVQVSGETVFVKDNKKKNPIIKFYNNNATNPTLSTLSSTSKTSKQLTFSTSTHEIYEGLAISLTPSNIPYWLALIAALL